MAFKISNPPSRWAQYCPAPGFNFCDGITSNDFIINFNIDVAADELTSVSVLLNENGLVSSITTKPNGTINTIPASGSTVMNYNAGDDTWTPASTFSLTDGTFYAFQVSLNVELSSGDSCSYDLTGTFQYIDLGSFPEASPTISGIRQVGEVLTGDDGYFDPDGDPQDIPNTVRRWYSYTDAAGTSGETLIGSGDTYTLTSAELGRYLRYKVIPAATSGPSPGVEASSSVTGEIITDVIGLTLDTSSTGTITFDFTVSKAFGIAIDWGDGNIDYTDFSLGLNVPSHTYSGGGTKTINFYFDPNTVTIFNGNNGDLTGSIDLTPLSDCSSINVSNQTGITLLDLPTGGASGFTNLSFPSCSSLTDVTFDVGAQMNGLINGTQCSALTNFDGSNLSGFITSMNFRSCDLDGVLDMQNIDIKTGTAGSIDIRGNSNLTDVNWGSGVKSGTVYRYWANSCGFTGTHTIPFAFSTAIQVNTSLRIYNNSNLTNIEISGEMRELEFYGCDITGTLDLSNIDFRAASTNCELRGFSNANLTSINLGTGKVGVIDTLQLYSCSIGYFSLGGITLTSNCTVDIKNNNMSHSEVNEWLVNFDPSGSGEDLLPASGTGSVNIAGTNAAPNTTSGGNDGVAAAASIASAGYTVTTS